MIFFEANNAFLHIIELTHEEKIILDEIIEITRKRLNKNGKYETIELSDVLKLIEIIGG